MYNSWKNSEQVKQTIIKTVWIDGSNTDYRGQRISCFMQSNQTRFKNQTFFCSTLYYAYTPEYMPWMQNSLRRATIFSSTVFGLLGHLSLEY